MNKQFRRLRDHHLQDGIHTPHHVEKFAAEDDTPHGIPGNQEAEMRSAVDKIMGRFRDDEKFRGNWRCFAAVRGR